MLAECRSRNCRIGEDYRKKALKNAPDSSAYAAVADGGQARVDDKTPEISGMLEV
jgi:hypothetical protein